MATSQYFRKGKYETTLDCTTNPFSIKRICFLAKLSYLFLETKFYKLGSKIPWLYFLMQFKLKLPQAHYIFMHLDQEISSIILWIKHTSLKMLQIKINKRQMQAFYNANKNKWKNLVKQKYQIYWNNKKFHSLKLPLKILN